MHNPLCTRLLRLVWFSTALYARIETDYEVCQPKQPDGT